MQGNAVYAGFQARDPADGMDQGVTVRQTDAADQGSVNVKEDHRVRPVFCEDHALLL